MTLPETLPLLVQLTGSETGGVRDFLRCLQQAWAAQDRSTEVLVFSEALASEVSLASRLEQMAGNRPCTLLLHYSGYGFHPRGLCRWLLREVEGARQAMGARLRIVTMFHELFAFGPPWRSAFWLVGMQASIAARLARASDAVWTNSQHHMNRLKQMVRAGTPVQVQPVFSTIGETLVVPAMTSRQRRLVVFGSAPTRSRALQKLPRHAACLRAQGIDEVLEVGSGTAVAGQHPGLRQRRFGRVDEQALRDLLATSMYALIDYPSVHLGKSSVFAAYAAHGCVVLNTAEPGPDADGLRAGVHHHWLGQADNRWHTEPQAIADAVRQWYAQHAIAVQAREFAHLCSLPLREDQNDD